MSPEYEALCAKMQQTLIKFLNSELEIGSSLAQSAFANRARNAGDYDRAKQCAIEAVESVRTSKDQVTDGIVREEIEKRLLELDRLTFTL